MKRREHSNLLEISNLKITIDELKSSMQKGTNEITTLKSEIKNLKTVKSTTDETEEVGKRLTNLNTLIEQETEARIFFNKDLEKRCSQLESPKENEAISKSESLAEKSIVTNQKLTTKKQQPNLKVATSNDISMKHNYYENASTSVVNSEQDTGPQHKVHQLSTNTNNITSAPVSKLNHLKNIKVNSTSRYISKK